MDIYEFITTEETAFQTSGVPVVDGYEFKMADHIRLSTLAKVGKFSTGADDGNRPYKNIMRPILNVEYRSEGFDLKDITPFVNDSDNYYKSLLVRRFHDKWARQNDIDTSIDESVESYVDYGIILAKDVGEKKPEIVPVQRIAFCDQTDILSGPICEKHSYSPDQLKEFAGKWDEDAIDEAITNAREEKPTQDNKQQRAKTPGKYIVVYELHGMFPESWLNEGGDEDKYTRQLHIVTYTQDEDNKEKSGITLFKGREKEGRYKVLKRDAVYGRACGFGGIEELIEPQVWTNYNEIAIKRMLDIASDIIPYTDDKSFANRNKLKDREPGEVVVLQEGKTLGVLPLQPVNVPLFERGLQTWEQHARETGSAADPQLGINPTSGTPLGTTQIVTAQGMGIHEYRRGKIATFWEEIYRDWILPKLVKEMDKGDKWLDELDLEELQFIAEKVSNKKGNAKAVEMAIKYFDKEGQAPTQEEIDTFKEVIKSNFMKDGNKRFIDIVEGELNKIPVDVSINIANKQKDLGKMANDMANIFRNIFANPQGFVQVMQIPAAAKSFNDMLEASGISPIGYIPQNTQITPQTAQPQQVMAQ